MFYGQHYHNVDKKGRVFMPAKFRDELGEEFMLCKSSNGKHCICVYPMSEWDKLDERLTALEDFDSEELARYIYAGAEKLSYDAQGRILIPQSLRLYAELDDEAAIIGMSSRIEIWSAKAFKADEARETPESIAALARRLGFKG